MRAGISSEKHSNRRFAMLIVPHVGAVAGAVIGHGIVTGFGYREQQRQNEQGGHDDDDDDHQFIAAGLIGFLLLLLSHAATGRFLSSTRMTLGWWAAATPASIWQKAQMMTRSPGLMRWAAAPLMVTSPEP